MAQDSGFQIVHVGSVPLNSPISHATFQFCFRGIGFRLSKCTRGLFFARRSTWFRQKLKVFELICPLTGQNKNISELESRPYPLTLKIFTWFAKRFHPSSNRTIHLRIQYLERSSCSRAFNIWIGSVKHLSRRFNPFKTKLKSV